MSPGSRPPSRGAGHARSSSTRRVIVSLEFLPGNTSVQTPITNEFSSHLPLTDLQWKSSSRSTTRTIETLSLDFQPFSEAVRDAPPQHIPINLLERPYLHLLFIASDDNEAYRITLRPQIREWLNAVQSKRAQEWLIIHVTSQKTGPSKFYQRKGSVFDKIRADFNLGKRDRVLQLPVPGSQADESATDYTAIWREFLFKSKESIVVSFDSNFTSYEEDVRKIDSQRQMPGWNFCTFFIQKEGLAHSFEAMNLLEDALIQYDELEASYYLGAKDQTLPWFSRIGGNTEGDDTLSILSSQVKPYRNLIMQNDISVFDFRTYLFSRQASLVCGLGRIVDLAKRARTFIYNMTKLLRAHSGVLRKYFIESWIYSASLEVVERCHHLLDVRQMNAAAIPDLLPMLAELTELATRQIEKLGMVFGYLPRKHPFLMSMQSLPVDELTDNIESPNGEDALDSPSHFHSSNAELQTSLAGQDAFDEMYRSLLDQVHEAWSGSLRARSANKIKATLAAFEQAREHNKRSLDIYDSLAKDYNRREWNAIEAQILRQTSALRSDSTDPQARMDRLVSVLALIKTGLEIGRLEWSIGEKDDDLIQIAGSLISDVRTLSQQLDNDSAVLDMPIFSVSLPELANGVLQDEDGIIVDAVITNHLPCPIQIDECRLKFMNRLAEPLWLQAGTQVLQPGKNRLTLSALVSLVGTYALEKSSIRIAHTVMQYSHKAHHVPNSIVDHRSHPQEHPLDSQQPVVTFTHDPHAIDILAEEAPDTHLGQARRMTLIIYPGKQALTKGVLRFLQPSNRIQIHTKTARVLGGTCQVAPLEKEAGFEISGIQGTTPLRINIDYDSLSPLQHIEIPVILDYHTSRSPERRRTLKTCIQLRPALPLAVNVQDFQRQTFLLSRFAISTDQALPLRIQSAEITDTLHFSATSAVKARSRPVIVQRNSPGGFLFRIERQKMVGNAMVEDVNAFKLLIVFTYRTIEAELRAVLTPHTNAVFKNHTLPLSPRFSQAVISLMLAEPSLLRRTNTLHGLSMIGQEDLRLAEQGQKPDLSRYKSHLRSFWTSDDEWDRIAEALRDVHTTSTSTSLLANEPWQTVSIPFEVPSIAVFNRVSLDLPLLTSYTPRVGEHLSCILNVHSSFDWANASELAYLKSVCDSAEDDTEGEQQAEQTQSRGQRMLYEVIAKPEDWIIGGKRKAVFFITSSTGSHIKVPLKLIPKREDTLFLPNIKVYPLPSVIAQQQAMQDKQLGMQSFDAYDELPTSETHQEDAATCVEVVNSNPSKADFWLDTFSGEVTAVGS